MLKVTLQPINDAVVVPNGSLLLPPLLGKKLNVAMSCGGNGICATCHVRVREGMDQLSAVGAKERRTLALVAEADPTSRLACQTHVHGDGVVIELPRGMYIEKADDLLSLLGTRAPENILHPIRGHILIPQGKIITRTLLGQSRTLDEEVRQMKDGLAGRGGGPAVAVPPEARSFPATGRGVAPRPVPRPVPLKDAAPAASGAPGPPAAAGPVPGSWHGGKPAATPPPLAHAAPATATARGGDSAPPVTPPPAGSNKSSVFPPAPGSAPGRSIGLSTASIEVRATDMVSVSLAARRDQTRTTVSSPAPGPVTTPAPLPTTGHRVGKFLLVECVGRGGLGVVFRALHTTLNIPVAIKFLRTQMAHDGDEFLDRFRAEARLLAQLNHPNVVRVLDFEDDPARAYVVMEFVEGLSIHELLAQTGRIWWNRAVALLLQAVDGLEAAGKLGIVHRDVKPANILVTRDGTAKVVDLGLAVRIDPEHGPASELSRSRVDGTVAYMCPERARNPAAVDLRADIYSLGITLFQMVTGRLPFTGTNAFEVIAAHACDPLPAAHEIASDVPPDVSAIVSRMAAKRPEDRFQSYGDVRAALQAVQKVGS